MMNNLKENKLHAFNKRRCSKNRRGMKYKFSVINVNYRPLMFIISIQLLRIFFFNSISTYDVI